MTVKLHLILLYILLISFGYAHRSSAQNDYLITFPTREIYQLITELRFDEASSKIELEKQNNPENLFNYLLENYIDFYAILIFEEREDFNKRKLNKKSRLKKLETGDSQNPYFRLTQAELHLQWAIARLKFEEYFTAVRETQKAYQLLKENEKLFPDFTLNKKGMAMIHAIVGTIPDNYRNVIEWVTGLEGDIPKSIEEMEELTDYCLQHDHIFLQEARVLHSFIELYLNNRPYTSWDIIESAKLDIKASPIACFTMATIAQRNRKTDKAIEILRKNQITKGQETFLFLDFMLGVNLLRQLNPSAKSHLLKFVSQFKGQHYIKEAYEYLAWYSLVIDSNEDLAKYYYELCIQSGNLLVDEDKSAYNEAISGKLPDPILLKIRLLYDGGYYEKAHKMLLSNKSSLIEKYPVEYRYRSGRLQQSVLQYDAALETFDYLLEMKEATNSYQQCNAALQSAIIHENMGNQKLAIRYYNRCLEMNPDKYKSSLHNKAKAGLERLKS